MEKKKILIIIVIVLLTITAIVAALQINRYFQDRENDAYIAQIEKENSVNTNSSEEKATTTDSKSPEEKFIEKYDTNGDKLLDSSEFPYSKLEKLNDIDKEKMGDYFMPYRSVQELIDDFDADYDKKLSVSELSNVFETLGEN